MSKCERSTTATVLDTGRSQGIQKRSRYLSDLDVITSFAGFLEFGQLTGRYGMTILRHDETDRFRVRDDNGNEHEVYELTAILDDSTVGGPDDTIPGLRELRTTGRRAVNKQGDRYEILGDGINPAVMADRID